MEGHGSMRDENHFSIVKNSKLGTLEIHGLAHVPPNFSSPYAAGCKVDTSGLGCAPAVNAHP
jgi:hypothetical protein